MNLTCVTLTGADDSIDPVRLCEISGNFPFVEWGILVGTHTRARFPSNDWLKKLSIEIAECGHDVRLSLHACGCVLRSMLDHKPMYGMPAAIDELNFSRVQLNFHGDPISAEQCENLKEAMYHDWIADDATIVQLDGANDWILDQLLAAGFEAHGLYDVSHGAGKIPESWPQANPKWIVGYAGGLGAENVVPQLLRIETAACGRPFWIDMETKLRTICDTQFDLSLCESVLSQTKPHVQAA